MGRRSGKGMLRPFLVRRLRPPYNRWLMTSPISLHEPILKNDFAENKVPDDYIVPDSEDEAVLSLHLNSGITPLRKEISHDSMTEIIEISDEAPRRLSMASTIELSDDSSRFTNKKLEEKSIAEDEHSSALRLLTRSQLMKSLLHDSSGSEGPTIDLSRFRWTGQKVEGNSKPLVNSIARPQVVLPSISSSTNSARKVHTGTYSFSNTELEKLLRCVSCSRTWTTRKAVATKLTHIRSCQKKFGIDDDTIRDRIRQELDKAEENSPLPTKKGKKKADTEATVSLVDEFVQMAQPKQRRRKKQTATTVIGIEHQHEFFAARAEANFSYNELYPKASPDVDERANDLADTPPLTQTFPTSKLGKSEPFHERYSYEPPVQEDRRVVSPKYKALQQNDNSASENEQLNCSKRSHDVPSAPSPQAHRQKPTSKLSPSTSRMTTSSDKAKKKTNSSTKLPRKGRPIADMETYDDEMFDISMEAMIKSDAKLWIRVLTYEPVELDEFIRLAAGDGVITPKLKKRVIKFLDAKAIHFISSGDSNKGRRR